MGYLCQLWIEERLFYGRDEKSRRYAHWTKIKLPQKNKYYYQSVKEFSFT